MSASIVGPWAREKLEQLRKYLDAYTTIMKEQQWCKGFAYIDAFAGPGVHAVRQRTRPKNFSDLMLEVAAYAVEEESQQAAFLAGSPQVALDLPNPFTWYVFIEKSVERKTALGQLLEPYKDSRKFKITQDDCNKYLLNQVVQVRG
jgi:three-Cys-motif partner protein